jgi:hypothetical protein
MDILELITKDKEEISQYLGDVPVEDFIEDVKNLIRKTSDKGVIEIAIEKLKELL